MKKKWILLIGLISLATLSFGGALEITQVNVLGSPEKYLMVSTNLTTEFGNQEKAMSYDSALTYLIDISLFQELTPVMDTAHDIGWTDIMNTEPNQRPFRWPFNYEQWSLAPGEYTANISLQLFSFKDNAIIFNEPWGEIKITVPEPVALKWSAAPAKRIKIFPNPFDRMVFFTGPVYEYQFYTISGKLVPGIRRAPPGQYVVRFKTASGWKTELAIKSVF